jgi:hypothetical protein
VTHYRRHTPPDAILGRTGLLRSIEALLRQQRSVLLVGPRDVGKTAIIGALDTSHVLIVDPFERITSHHAWRIRRAMDHGAVCIAAARTLDRARLGHVRRIAFRFTTVRVPPLPNALIRRLLQRELASARVSRDLISSEWIKRAAGIARGRPGIAVGIAREAARALARSGRFLIPAVAFVEASVGEMSETTRPTTHDSDRSTAHDTSVK